MERLPELFLKEQAAARAGRGHPWIFSNEIAGVSDESITHGDFLVRNHKKEILGSAFYNKHALISARIYSRRPEPFTDEMLRERMQAAFARRSGDVSRLVFSEADQLPGLIIDRYQQALSVQINTLGMEKRRRQIVSQLIYHGDLIVDRSDAHARQAEGLDEIGGVIHGELSGTEKVTINGMQFELDLGGGQKTGLFLDQRFNWKLVEGLARGRRVLDLFCNAGGFAMSAKRGGAVSVWAVDSSEHALDQLRKNMDNNQIEDIKIKKADAFQYVRAAPGEFDLIICDPPPLARSAKQVKNALRGYRELNRWCIKMLSKRGRLLTFSCSGAVSPSTFEESVLLAARDAGRQFRRLPFFAQPPDHPIVLSMPESHYLKGLLLEAVE